MNKVKLIWRVAPAPTGRYRSFEHRAWPSASYAGGQPAASLYCSDDYRPASARAGTHMSITICLNKHWAGSWTVFTLRRRAATLDEAKRVVQEFLDAHPEWHPKEAK